MITVLGEIKVIRNTLLDIEQIVRDCCKESGYDHIEKGLDYRTLSVITEINIDEIAYDKGKDRNHNS